MAELGIETLGTKTSFEDFIIDGFNMKSLPITIATGEGELVKGTPMKKVAETGKYVVADDFADCAGVLLEDIDATSEVNTYIVFDTVLNTLGIEMTTTPDIGFYETSAITLKEVQ